MCHSTKISFLKWGYRSLSEVVSVCTVLFYIFVYLMVLLVTGYNWIPAATSHASLFLFFTMLEKTLFVEGCNDRIP